MIGICWDRSKKVKRWQNVASPRLAGHLASGLQLLAIVVELPLDRREVTETPVQPDGVRPKR
jgi:hypothetical protein